MIKIGGAVVDAGVVGCILLCVCILLMYLSTAMVFTYEVNRESVAESMGSMGLMILITYCYYLSLAYLLVFLCLYISNEVLANSTCMVFSN